MRTAHAKSARGFTLLETTIALAILAIALLGALAAINHSGLELRRGQQRLYHGALADTALQRLKLDAAARASLRKNALSLSTLSDSPEKLAIGDTWVRDPVEAYFEFVTGSFRPIDLADSPACDSSALPDGAVCREMLVTLGVGNSDCASKPAPPFACSTTAFTIWIRVWRKGDPLKSAIVHREVYDS